MTVLSLARKSAVCLALIFAINLCAPIGHTASAKSIEKQTKQARKVQAKLAKYAPGALVHVEFRDGSESTGKLGKMSENSFVMINSDSNAHETHQYSDVSKVEKGKEYIGKNSTPRRWHPWPF